MNMDARKNRRVIATIFIAALVSVIVLLVTFSSDTKNDRVTAEGESLITTSTECRTTTTTTSTSTTMKKTTTTSTSTSATSTTTTETTTVATTTEQVVETEPVAPEPQPEPQNYNEQIIGGNGTVTINGWTFNSPIDAQYLYERCAEYGIDPSVMYGVMMAESTMGTACANLCGITPVAAQSYNNSTGNDYWNWASDPYQNLEISLYCLSGAYNYYGNGSTYDALAGYNTGYYGHAAGTYSWYAETVISYANSAY